MLRTTADLCTKALGSACCSPIRTDAAGRSMRERGACEPLRPGASALACGDAQVPTCGIAAQED
jgi:hypothetical protein